ncbi:MAG: hypothetical protein KBC44_03355 [Candidatus Pacebacteria bacterium]|nr:hypothetical protein [Candidatus Paceibacterota bacterium]
MSNKERQAGVGTDKRRLPKLRDAENKLYELLSTDWCGNDSPPLTYRKMTYGEDGCEYVVVFEEDSSALGFGYPDEWKLFIDRKNFHKVVRWYLKQWAWGDWFGVRRWLWYKLLHRKVERTIAIGKKMRGE